VRHRESAAIAFSLDPQTIADKFEIFLSMNRILFGVSGAEFRNTKPVSSTKVACLCVFRCENSARDASRAMLVPTQHIKQEVVTAEAELDCQTALGKFRTQHVA
jgi:hypothetical protein